MIMLHNKRKLTLELIHDLVVTCKGELIATVHDLEFWKETLDVFEVSIIDTIDFSRIMAFNADLTLTWTQFIWLFC